MQWLWEEVSIHHRLRKHELDRHISCRFIPMATPRQHQSMPSVVTILSLHTTTSTPLKTSTPTPIWKLNESTRHALMELDQEMPDFADMFSQLIRYARASSNYSDFLKRHLHLRNRLLNQGYKKIRLIWSLSKFIFRDQDLVEIYFVSAEKIIDDWFSYSENV